MEQGKNKNPASDNNEQVNKGGYTMNSTELTILLFSSVVLGLIPATIAGNKGRSFIKWWIYGTLLWVISLVHSICLQGNTKCPECDEWISKKAKICKHCNTKLVKTTREVKERQHTKEELEYIRATGVDTKI